MSQTIIFAFDKEGNSEEYGYTKNAWRGAMAVWDIMGKRHLGVGVSLFNESAMKQIWGLMDDKRVPMNERIVMGTTLDRCLVRNDEIPKVIEAFKDFEGETSLKEQADILQEIYDSGDFTAVGWHQTADDVITAMAAHLTVLSFAGQNTGGMDIRERSGRKNNTMRDVLISIPTLAYKDWRIFFNFGDEDEEDRAVRSLRKEFPYRDDVEKVKR